MLNQAIPHTVDYPLSQLVDLEMSTRAASVSLTTPDLGLCTTVVT